MTDAREKARITVKWPELYAKQNQALFAPARYCWIEGSTKSGKTLGALIWIGTQAFLAKDHENLWWVTPSIKQARIAFNRLARAIPKGLRTTNKSERTIKIRGAGTLHFLTGEKPDNLYGEDVRAAVIDEGSRMREAAFFAVRSTLTATQGPIRLVGNVTTRTNWFYRLCRLAEQGRPNHRYTKIVAQDAVDAGVLPVAELDDAKAVLPKSVYDALYRCIPADDGLNPFTLDAIEDCIIPVMSNMAPVAYGLDLAKKQDWTVLIGLDESGNVCRHHRWQKIKWDTQKDRLLRLVDAPCMVDATGVGDVVFDFLEAESDLFTPFEFTNTSKQSLMEDLEFGIQTNALGVVEGSKLEEELKAFEFTHIGRKVYYSAPQGLHDDEVMALGMAYRHQLSHKHWTWRNPPVQAVDLPPVPKRQF